MSDFFSSRLSEAHWGGVFWAHWLQHQQQIYFLSHKMSLLSLSAVVDLHKLQQFSSMHMIFIINLGTVIDQSDEFSKKGWRRGREGALHWPVSVLLADRSSLDGSCVAPAHLRNNGPMGSPYLPELALPLRQTDWWKTFRIDCLLIYNHFGVVQNK